MDKTLFTRRLFQVITFVVFLIQVYNSILKYNDGTIIQKQTTLTIDEIKHPNIFVCLANHYNYTKSLSYGYKYKTSFYTGKLTNSDRKTWRGKYQNLTFKDIHNGIFDQEFGYFTVKGGTYNKVFSNNYGYCMHLDNNNTFAGDISATKQSFAVMADPYKLNNLNIYEMENTRVTFGPTNNQQYEFQNFEPKISLYDSRIKDGISCIDYERINSSYGQCIKDAMRRRLLHCFGCLPLWFPGNSGEGCEVDKDVHVQDDILYEEVFQDIWELTGGKEIEYLKVCLPPCMSMEVIILKTEHLRNFPDYSVSSFKFKRDVLVYTDIFAYDEFSLIVDFGSAMGLWLGLSALNFLDYALSICSFLFQRVSVF